MCGCMRMCERVRGWRSMCGCMRMCERVCEGGGVCVGA